MGYIYKITNTINNKAYIGITINPNPIDRWRAHKPVTQYSLNNNIIGSYYSIIEATEKTGVKRANIQSAATGRAKTAGGFIWKYDSTEPKDNTIVYP